MSGSTSSFPPFGLLDPAQGGQPPPGSGLGALYQAVTGNMMQQQGAVPPLGTGWSGLPAGVSANPQQWTTAQWDANPQGPTAMMRAAMPQQQAPAFDASGIDPQTLGALRYAAPAMDALAAAGGVPNPYAGVDKVPMRGQGLLGAAVGQGGGGGGGYGGNVTGGSTGALGAGGPPGGSGNAAVDAAAAASEHAASEEEQDLGGLY